MLNAIQALKPETIIGGSSVLSNTYTYHVLVEFKDISCGGSILNEWHVVSAAHCVFDHNGKLRKKGLKIVTGVNHVTTRHPNRVEILVKHVLVPRDFPWRKMQLPFQDDIAVLKLASPLDLADGSHLSKLDLPTRQIMEGETAVVTGAGMDIFESRPRFVEGRPIYNGYTTGKLRRAEARLLDDHVCLAFKWFLLSMQFCARIEQTGHARNGMPDGLCRGDSGGPLVYNGTTLVGIVSSGPFNCDESHNAAVYTNVFYFKGFIETALQTGCDKRTMFCHTYKRVK